MTPPAGGNVTAPRGRRPVSATRLTAPARGSRSGSYRETFVSAARPGWWILAACGLAVLVLGAVTSGGWAPAGRRPVSAPRLTAPPAAAVPPASAST